MYPHASVNYSDIPSELMPLKQWMPYRLETRDGHPTKIPYSATVKHQRGKTNDPSDWGTLAEARYMSDTSQLDGVGFIFTENDNYVCIDLDNVVDDSGVIESWAQDLVDKTSTYTEFSQSGKGIHIIIKG